MPQVPVDVGEGTVSRNPVTSPKAKTGATRSRNDCEKGNVNAGGGAVFLREPGLSKNGHGAHQEFPGGGYFFQEGRRGGLRVRGPPGRVPSLIDSPTV